MSDMFNINGDQFNTNLTADLLSKDDGIRKSASDNIENWLHTYQRQNGVWRRVLPIKPITQEDFAEDLETRDPYVIRPIIPRSVGAFTVNFDTGTAAHTMYAEKYAIYIQRIMTPKYRIDKIYLTAYKGDLIQIFKDLMLQDVLETEDLLGITQLNAIVGPEKGDASYDVDLGIKQYIDAGLTINPDSVFNAVEGLSQSNDNINPAQALVHRSFWWGILRTFDASRWGDRLAERSILGKTDELEEAMAGISYKTVLEKTLIPQNTMYVMAEPKYCGEFLTYEDTTLFTKVDDDIWFEMFAHETMGMQFANKGAVVRADFGSGEYEGWELSEASAAEPGENVQG